MPRVKEDIKLDFKDVLIEPKRSVHVGGRGAVNLKFEDTWLHSKKQFNGIPIMASNMDKTGTTQMAKVLHKHDFFTCLHKFCPIPELKAMSKESPQIFSNLAVSIEAHENDLKFLEELVHEVPHIQHIVIDDLCLSPNFAYNEQFIYYIRKLRSLYPEHTIITGNVCTPEAVEAHLLAGADIIKVGVGPGSVCTTRTVTGIGYPQLSAILECAEAAHGLGGHIICDGGCVTSGDIGKAFAAGADFVMLGGMLAGHEESEGSVMVKGGEKFKRFHGMASAEAMDSYYDSEACVEGKSVDIPCKGPVENTLNLIKGTMSSEDECFD